MNPEQPFFLFAGSIYYANGKAPRGAAPAKRASAHDEEDFAPPAEDDDIPF